MMSSSFNEEISPVRRMSRQVEWPVVQINGQRIYGGPPVGWCGPPPPRGTEVYLSRLPINAFENEICTLLSTVGNLYSVRIMMNFSGTGKGFAFAQYSTREEAVKAIKTLNGVQIMPGTRGIIVEESHDNCCLRMERIPKQLSVSMVKHTLQKRVEGVVDVTREMYPDGRENRSCWIVEFSCHRLAALARRTLIAEGVQEWPPIIRTEWAKPERRTFDGFRPRNGTWNKKTVPVFYVQKWLNGTTISQIITVLEVISVNVRFAEIILIHCEVFLVFDNERVSNYVLDQLGGVKCPNNGMPLIINCFVVTELQLFYLREMKAEQEMGANSPCPSDFWSSVNLGQADTDGDSGNSGSVSSSSGRTAVFSPPAEEEDPYLERLRDFTPRRLLAPGPASVPSWVQEETSLPDQYATFVKTYYNTMDAGVLEQQMMKDPNGNVNIYDGSRIPIIPGAPRQRNDSGLSGVASESLLPSQNPESVAIIYKKFAAISDRVRNLLAEYPNHGYEILKHVAKELCWGTINHTDFEIETTCGAPWLVQIHVDTHDGRRNTVGELEGPWELISEALNKAARKFLTAYVLDPDMWLTTEAIFCP